MQTWLLRYRPIVAACGLLAISGLGRAGEPTTKASYIYKEVAGCRIQADVWRDSTARVEPVLLWIHGGALIMGHRGQIDRHLRSRLIDAGFVVVSIDYRLAPETKLPAILDDVQDACRWVRRRGPGLFHGSPDQLAVMGASAGGYLTLTTGFRVRPAPRAIVSLWGYGDIAGKWYSRPDPFYSRLPPVSREEAYRSVGREAIAESSRPNKRQRFYLYCRQHGLWPQEVAGFDPDKDPAAFDRFCPIRIVTTNYPPTLLVHGTADTDVPYAQSVDMERELTRRNVKHELITITGGGHGLAGVTPEIVFKTYDRVVNFLREHLR